MPSDTCLQRVWPGGPPCDLAPGHPGQHHGGWSSVAHRLADELAAAHPAHPLAGVEPGVRTSVDPDDVRGAHVPWPGQADDGTCSCCGMPHPCVARRLADEVEQLRAEVNVLRRAMGVPVADRCPKLGRMRGVDWRCTRQVGHLGPHAADMGTGVATWDDQ